MNFKEFCKKLGLTAKQGEVYESVFSLGSASAADVARQTGINRTLIYDHLNVLVEKGLVSLSVANGKRVFTALPPETLVETLEDELRERESERERALKEIAGALPELKRRFNSGGRVSASILLGEKGVRNLFRDIVSTLKRGEEDLVFIANYEGRRILGNTIEQYYARCGRKGTRIRVIFDSRPETIRVAHETARLRGVTARLLPADYSSLTTFHVYGGKVSLLLFSEGEVFGLLVDNAKIADGLRKHFEALWKNAEPVKN